MKLCKLLSSRIFCYFQGPVASTYKTRVPALASNYQTAAPRGCTLNAKKRAQEHFAYDAVPFVPRSETLGLVRRGYFKGVIVSEADCAKLDEVSEAVGKELMKVETIAARSTWSTSFSA